MATTAFFAFLALVIIEMILSASLLRLYFRVGFPLFVYRVAIDFPDRSLPSSQDLTALLPESVFTRLLIGEIGMGSLRCERNSGVVCSALTTPRSCTGCFHLTLARSASD